MNSAMASGGNVGQSPDRPSDATEVASGTGVKLHLGPLDRVTVSVAVAPYVSTLSLLTDAFRGRCSGLPRSLADALRRIRMSVDGSALSPMIAPGHSVAPDVVIPVTPSEDVPARTHLEYLREAPETAVTDDLSATFGARLPRHWQHVADRPRRWLYDYARAARGSWEILEPEWRRSEGALRREIDRVAIAVARRQHEVLFTGLSEKVRFSGDTLYFPDSEAATYELNGRPLVLVPMMSSTNAMIANFDRSDVVWIGYPLPGLGSAGRQADDPSEEGAAELVLGWHRAVILRMLDRSFTMGELAERLHYNPSTLTHHCNQLVRAGLLARERRGRQVVLRRTDRGVSLLDLLAES